MVHWEGKDEGRLCFSKVTGAYEAEITEYFLWPSARKVASQDIQGYRNAIS